MKKLLKTEYYQRGLDPYDYKAQEIILSENSVELLRTENTVTVLTVGGQGAFRLIFFARP